MKFNDELVSAAGLHGKRVAVLEDDPGHARVIENVVLEGGGACQCFGDGKTMLRDLHRSSFDFFVLDWRVPHVQGPDIVRWIRRNITERVPVLFVTSCDDERDVIEGLDCGADDYMIKPVRPSELKARMRALMRRAYPVAPLDAGVNFGPYSFELHRKEIRLHDELIVLKPKEYQLAQFLFRNVGRLLARDQLMTELWGTDVIESRTLVTHMSQVRRKLQLGPQNGYRLVPVYSLGYRLEAMDSAESENKKES